MSIPEPLKHYEDNLECKVIMLNDVILIKPIRGGPSLFRTLAFYLKENTKIKVLKVELAKGRSIYIFPASAFRKGIKLSIKPLTVVKGKNVLFYVKEGCLVIDPESVKEIDVEVKKEKNPWSFSELKVFVNSKDILHTGNEAYRLGPGRESHSTYQELPERHSQNNINYSIQ